MKIFLADPHLEVRAALRLVLEQQPDIQVVGEGRDMIELIGQIIDNCPDVILLDPSLPGLNLHRRTSKSSLEEFLETVHRLCPYVSVIVISSQPKTQEYTGVDGFVCKSDPPETLLSLLEHAMHKRR